MPTDSNGQDYSGTVQKCAGNDHITSVYLALHHHKFRELEGWEQEHQRRHSCSLPGGELPMNVTQRYPGTSVLSA
jgi:hypothetical protein